MSIVCAFLPVGDQRGFGASAASRSIETVISSAVLLGARRADVDGRRGDDAHREPRTSGRAHDRVRAGQDGAAPGAGVYGLGQQHRGVSAATSGGTGPAVGGSTTAPVDGYVDWLGNDGSLLGGGRPRRPTGSTSACGRSAAVDRVETDCGDRHVRSSLAGAPPDIDRRCHEGMQF